MSAAESSSPYQLPADSTTAPESRSRSPLSRLTSRAASPSRILSDSYYFQEQFYPLVSRSPPSFLDYILNPTEPRSTPRNSPPFGYRLSRPSPSPSPPRPSPPRHGLRRILRSQSPVLPSANAYTPTGMPSTRRSNGYVDLTSDRSSPPVPLRRTTKRPVNTSPGEDSAEPQSGPSTKRVRRNDGTSAEQIAPRPGNNVEEIDLSDEKTPLKDALRKQHLEAVKAQQEPSEKPLRLSTLTCVICMDTPTDITATSCGHLFCYTCLMEALIAGENRTNPGETRKSQCPVCRKFINRMKTADIIPLLMKKGLNTQPTKNSIGNSKKEPA